MKLFLCLLLSIFLLTNCKKDQPIACIEKKQNPDWQTIVFKYDYTIQIPSDYTGVGAIGWEGLIFSKHRRDSSVILDYAYCGALFCDSFGEILSNPEPISIAYMPYFNQQLVVTLDQKVNFCENNEVVAIFYYNNSEKRFGKLYMKIGNDYREALKISYTAARQREVEHILKTIKGQ